MVERDRDMSTNPPVKLIRWLNFVQFCLLPGICVVCQRPSCLHRDLCQRCEAVLPRVCGPCPGCALPLPPGRPANTLCGKCTMRRPVWTTVAPFCWQAEIIPLVSGFKYRQNLAAGRVLGQVLETVLRDVYRDSPLPELLLPVPLHTSRLQERGYNQALLLARQLGATFDIPVNPQVLQRVRSTPPQQGLNAIQRRQNLRGAFAVADASALNDISRIALIDDVITTMTTLRMLALELGRASAAPLEIHAWALARA